MTMTMLFRSSSRAHAMTAEIVELNELAEGSVEYDAISEMWESILDRHVQCRHRYCGTCNGVGCEESVEVAISVELLNATLHQRNKAGELPYSATKAAQYQYDDEGRCHY